jgi:hypothetical protein
VVLGTAAAIAAVLAATGTGTGINTAYIERLNATFRAAVCPLVRRGRALVRGEGVLTGWMDLVGCAYNFCWQHDTRMPPSQGTSNGRLEPQRWRDLLDHRWTGELLSCDPAAWVAPRARTPIERICGTCALPV